MNKVLKCSCCDMMLTGIVASLHRHIPFVRDYDLGHSVVSEPLTTAFVCDCSCRMLSVGTVKVQVSVQGQNRNGWTVNRTENSRFRVVLVSLTTVHFNDWWLDRRVLTNSWLTTSCLLASFVKEAEELNETLMLLNCGGSRPGCWGTLTGARGSVRGAGLTWGQKDEDSIS